jgi:VCBS repeat-containing protein
VRSGMRSILAAAFALSVVAVECSNNASAGGGGGDTVSISSPAAGAKVSEPFTLTLSSNQALGDPSTGDDHVHLCFDGASCDSGSYQHVYSNTAQVQGLSPGQHTIEASLRHADHSAVGPTATITVTVTGAGAATNGAPSVVPSPTATGSRGYGY